MGPPQFIPSSYRAYAVDGDGDGRRDLLGNWDDILMSVANYFVKNGWQTGEPVTVRGLSNEDLSVPTGKNSLKLTETVASLTERNIQFDTSLDADAPAQLISLEGEAGPEYWIGFHNFYVITRYNHSAMYALAVYQLSDALSAARSAAADTSQGKAATCPDIPHTCMTDSTDKQGVPAAYRETGRLPSRHPAYRGLVRAGRLLAGGQVG